MKKFAALLAACVVSLFVGCGGEAPKAPEKTGATATPTTTAEATKADATPAATVEEKK